MPAREISTTIKLDGEKKFNAALRDAQQELRVMGSDLKAAAAEFSYTGDKQQLLTEKSRILRNEIAQQDKIVEALAQAVKDSAEKYGDASKTTDGYRIKLNNAKATLFKLKQQLAETDREAEELGRDSVRVGRQIKDGIGDAAEETSERLDDMIKKLSSDVGSIKNSTVFTALSAGASFVTGSIDKIVDFVENSRDYRNKRALATNAIEKNLNASEEEINRLYLKIVGITGDTDSAYEALTTLSKTGADSFTELNNILDIILGAYIQFGEEAKVEDVAESMQESVATGTLTGKIAELYERLGMDVEAINKAIKDLPPKERLQAIINGLTGNELSETYRTFSKENENLIKENQKLAELELAKAKLADELSPIVIEITDKLIFAVDTLTETLSLLKGDVDKVAKEYGMTEEQYRIEMAKKTGNSGWVNPKDAPGFAESMQNIWTGFKDIFSGGSPKEQGETDGEEYAAAAEKAVTDEIPTMQEITSAFLSGGDEAVKSLIDSRVMSDDDKAELLNMLKELGLNSGKNYDDGMQESMQNAADNAAISGANVGTSLKNGMDSTLPLAVASAQSYAAQINAAYASIGMGLSTSVSYPRIPGQAATGGAALAGAGNTTAIFTVNGREFARGVLPAINSMQGRAFSRIQSV